MRRPSVPDTIVRVVQMPRITASDEFPATTARNRSRRDTRRPLPTEPVVLRPVTTLGTCASSTLSLSLVLFAT